MSRRPALRLNDAAPNWLPDNNGPIRDLVSLWGQL